jgi:RNase P subunit RPR2
VCGCLLRTAAACPGCYTPLLYGMTAASINTVKGRLTLILRWLLAYCLTCAVCQIYLQARREES